ncbi:MAG: hypothetical protein WD737_00460 [Gemmatimonadota bacterium]
MPSPTPIPLTAMYRIALAATLVLGACIRIGGSEPEPRQRADDVETLVAHLQEDVEAHTWQNILSMSDPAHYRIQVVEMGIPEPQYVAELLGLHGSDNDIQEGDTLDWADLERISTVSIQAPSNDEPPYRLSGTAVLDDGSTLRLDVQVSEIRGRFVFTGGVG